MGVVAQSSAREGVHARRLLLLALAPLSIFVWQFVITRTLLESPHGSMGMYYFGRGVLALAVALLFARIPRLRTREGDVASILIGLVAGLAPCALGLAPDNGVVAGVACFAAGAASSWLYLRVFLMFSRMPLGSAVCQLLGALAVSYLLRMGLGFIPVGVLPLVGLLLPLACVLIVRWGLADLGCGGDAAVPEESRRREDRERGLFWLFVCEFAVFGCVAGLVRTPYEMAQFDLVVSVGGGILLSICTLALLWWARRRGEDVHLNGICQGVLLLLLTVLFVLVMFGSEGSAAAAIASLFARFGVYTLLLYVLCVFVVRGETHAYVTFGLGWGLFSLATGVGMAVATLTSISRLSSAVALGIVYVLVALSLVASARMRGNDLLFASEGEPAVPRPAAVSLPREGEACEGVDGRLMDDVMRRCGEIGETGGLTKREIEVVQLICLGRSKGYIAESLSITENTVRGYAKNAYRKLGIHSRQELLTLVGMR